MPKRSDKLGEAVVDREAMLRGERSDLMSLWQSIARYVIPRSATFTEEITPGVERNRFVLDSTAPRSLELFASFLHTLLNNPSTDWFRLAVAGDDKLNRRADVVRVKDANRARMMAAMSSQSANLYSHLHQVYLDLGAFGTAVLFVELALGRIWVRAFHLADVVIDENSSGFVDVVMRQFSYTPRQARQRWPDKDLGPALEKQLDAKRKKSGSKKVRFIHAVFPSDDEHLMSLIPDRERARIEASGAAFASVWVNAEDRVTVTIGLYQEMPYMIPRWYKTRMEKYGRSPAMTVIPDIRMVNRMMETILRGAEKLVDPPLVLPDGGLVSPIRMFGGGVTFTDGEVNIQTLIPPGASRIDVGDDLLVKRQEAIRDGFFVPLFITPESPVKTATQVLQEVDERNRAISPMLMRVQSELFFPLIERFHNIMSRAGALVPMPADVADAEMQIEYSSPVVGSQRQLEGLSTLRLFEGAAPWSQADPGIMDWYDSDELAQTLHAASGAPGVILRTQQQVDAVRQAKQEQAQSEQQAQLAFEGADATAKLIKAQR